MLLDALQCSACAVYLPLEQTPQPSRENLGFKGYRGDCLGHLVSTLWECRSLAFQAGTAKNKSLSDSKLNKHKITFSWCLWGSISDRYTDDDKLSASSDRYSHKSIEVTYILLKLTLNLPTNRLFTSSDKTFHWMVVESVQMTDGLKMVNYLRLKTNTSEVSLSWEEWLIRLTWESVWCWTQMTYHLQFICRNPANIKW